MTISLEFNLINFDLLVTKEPGEVEFTQPVHLVKESVGTFEITVERKNGADGKVSIGYKTGDINAIEGKDYVGSSGELEFKHGEITKTITITVIDGEWSKKLKKKKRVF